MMQGLEQIIDLYTFCFVLPLFILAVFLLGYLLGQRGAKRE